MSLTRIMLVDESRVPLTVTCLPLKCLAFIWSSSWYVAVSVLSTYCFCILTTVPEKDFWVCVSAEVSGAGVVCVWGSLELGCAG